MLLPPLLIPIQLLWHLFPVMPVLCCPDFSYAAHEKQSGWLTLLALHFTVSPVSPISRKNPCQSPEKERAQL